MSGEPRVPRGSVRGLWDSISRYAKDDAERDLLDLAFRSAFQLHPDYWHEFDVLLMPSAAHPTLASGASTPSESAKDGHDGDDMRRAVPAPPTPPGGA